jgi:hypothetical protein
MSYNNSLSDTQLRASPIATTMGTIVSSFSIPAITSATSYAKGEQLGSVLTFSNMASGAGQPFELLSISIDDTTNNTNANSSFYLLLFKESPVITSTDTTSFAISSTEFMNAKLISEETLNPEHLGSGGSTSKGGTSITPNGGIAISGTTGNIYGVLVGGNIAINWVSDAVNNLKITIVSAYL